MYLLCTKRGKKPGEKNCGESVSNGQLNCIVQPRNSLLSSFTCTLSIPFLVFPYSPFQTPPASLACSWKPIAATLEVGSERAAVHGSPLETASL